MSIYINPVNKSQDPDLPAGDERLHIPLDRPQVRTASQRLLSFLSWVLAIVVLGCLGGGAYYAWDQGLFDAQPKVLTDAQFQEHMRSITVAAELRETVRRKLSLDQAYLVEAQKRKEEQLALTFKMSIDQATEDFRNAGSNWVASMMPIYGDFVDNPEFTKNRLETFRATLKPTQKSAINAVNTTLFLLQSTEATANPELFFASKLIEEPE